MKEIKVQFGCCLCADKYETVVEIPDEWSMRYDELYEEKAFCPSHALIAEWADAQCVGCVGSWADCTLWNDFAYRKHNLQDADFVLIEAGICPRRTNGTFAFSGGKIEQLNISDTGTSESGKCLSRAIKDYWEKYPS